MACALKTYALKLTKDKSGSTGGSRTAPTPTAESVKSRAESTRVLNLRELLFLVLSLAFWVSMMTVAGCAERQLTAPTPQMDAAEPFWIRVLLAENLTNCTLKVPSSFSVTNTHTQTAQAHFDQVDVPINVTISAGRITIAGRAFRGNEVIILPHDPYIFNVNGDDYRGKLKLTVNPDGDSFEVVNVVPLEPYLAGVVGAEMPDYWQPAALAAQAVAARTYCLYIKRRFGSKRRWDVRQTAANQVYLGCIAESAKIWEAVNRTYGRVLVCKHPNGSEDIFPAYYCSTCGGHTENSKHVFGDSFQPLRGVRCPYCKDVAKLSSFFWPMAEFDKAKVSTALLQRYPKLKQLAPGGRGEITSITGATYCVSMEMKMCTK